MGDGRGWLSADRSQVFLIRRTQLERSVGEPTNICVDVVLSLLHSFSHPFNLLELASTSTDMRPSFLISTVLAIFTSAVTAVDFEIGVRYIDCQGPWVGSRLTPASPFLDVATAAGALDYPRTRHFSHRYCIYFIKSMPAICTVFLYTIGDSGPLRLHSTLEWPEKFEVHDQLLLERVEVVC
ncbi:hypothetical protein C8J55DRAFT_139699 [Lentinula edodes]|uniref:Uncharacterized protein n=1 Tax=Lentinula lateritia TaxID=40482 RepID=A0A9W9A3B3_9AGAR|nr:hypothetical protein C8J55DRAFT_139699 [Lentinula edodes]